MTLLPGLGSIVSACIGHDRGMPVHRPAIVVQSLADVGGGLDLHVLLSPYDNRYPLASTWRGLTLFLSDAREGDGEGQWRRLPPSSPSPAISSPPFTFPP